MKREKTQKHTHRGRDRKTRISINRKEYILKKNNAFIFRLNRKEIDIQFIMDNPDLSFYYLFIQNSLG